MTIENGKLPHQSALTQRPILNPAEVKTLHFIKLYICLVKYYSNKIKWCSMTLRLMKRQRGGSGVCYISIVNTELNKRMWNKSVFNMGN